MLLFRYCLFISFIRYVFFRLSGTLVLELELFRVSRISFSFILILDKVRVRFRMVVTLISGRVFFFSNSYIEEDPFSDRFI